MYYGYQLEQKPEEEYIIIHRTPIKKKTNSYKFTLGIVCSNSQHLCCEIL